MKVKVISLPFIFPVLYVLCFTRSRYQVSVYRTIGPLVFAFLPAWVQKHFSFCRPNGMQKCTEKNCFHVLVPVRKQNTEISSSDGSIKIKANIKVSVSSGVINRSKSIDNNTD